MVWDMASQNEIAAVLRGVTKIGLGSVQWMHCVHRKEACNQAWVGCEIDWPERGPDPTDPKSAMASRGWPWPAMAGHGPIGPKSPNFSEPTGSTECGLACEATWKVVAFFTILGNIENGTM